MRSRGSAAKSAKSRAAAITNGDGADSKPSKPAEPAEPEQQPLDGIEDDEQDAKPKPRVSATADPSELSLGDGHDRIVDTLFDLPDPFQEYQAIKASLRLGTKASRADYGTLVDALDQAEEMAERAFALLVNTKVARDSYEIDAQAIEGGMRDQAMAALMAEYKAKERKSPTNADVEAYMATKFPDEWRDIQTRRAKARRTVAYLENLSYRASERAKDVRQMVARARDA